MRVDVQFEDALGKTHYLPIGLVALNGGSWQPSLPMLMVANRLPLLPGVASASEVMAANADGLAFLKFFPAQQAGGVAMLKALGGPFPDVVFCPTGGITAETAPQFLALPNVAVCGGSWLTPADAIKAGDWDLITDLARSAAALRKPA